MGVNTFLHGRATRYRVTGAAIMCELMAGGEKMLYRGSVLPADASPAHVAYLLALGVIEEV